MWLPTFNQTWSKDVISGLLSTFLHFFSGWTIESSSEQLGTFLAEIGMAEINFSLMEEIKLDEVDFTATKLVVLVDDTLTGLVELTDDVMTELVEFTDDTLTELVKLTDDIVTQLVGFIYR